MNFLRKPFLHLEREISAGGSDYVPPTHCPRPAHASANTPAHVEATEGPVTKKMDGMWTVRPVPANGPILSSELTV